MFTCIYCAFKPICGLGLGLVKSVLFTSLMITRPERWHRRANVNETVEIKSPLAKLAMASGRAVLSGNT